MKDAITGYYWDGSLLHGFVRKKTGKITTFDPHPRHSSLTYPGHINELGEIAGYSVDDGGYTRGFIRDPR